MVNFKKSLAMFLAIIMIFSSFSVAGFAAEAIECTYGIEVYRMDTNGIYPEEPEYSGEYHAVAGTMISVPLEYFDSVGFTLDSEKSVTTFEANADNSSVGKLYYSRNKYTATYIYEDLVGSQTEQSDVYYGAEIPAFEANPSGKPSMQGYNFIMWSLDENERVAVPETMPAYDIDMYPVYEIKTYTYIFDAGNGGIFSNGEQTFSVEYSYGDIPEKPEEPVMPHKEFVDWDEDIPSTVTGNLTFNAIYNDITYSVIFMDAEEEISYMEYFYGDIIEELDIPEGYEAWTLSDGTYVEFPHTVTGNAVFYAASAPSEYTARFYLDIDDTEPYEEFTAFQGEEIDFPAEPEREGYTFIGWNSDIIVMPGEDVDFIAEWEKIEVNEDYLEFKTEIYRQDETTGEWVVADKIERGETVKARVFIETGFATGDGQVLIFYNDDVFTGDYSGVKSLVTNPSATSTTGQYMVSGNCTSPSKTHSKIVGLVEDGYISEEFLAKHTPITFTFSFADLNSHAISGDEWFAEFELTAKEDAAGKGDFFIVPETIQNSGDGYYAYIGLSKGVEGESSLDNESMMYLDLPATVESKPVSTGYGRVVFDANGGFFKSAESDQIVFDAEVGAPIEIFETPVKQGYVFHSWDIELPDVMTEEVLDSKAVWKAADDTVFTVIVNYTDFSNDEAVETVKSYDYTGTTGNAIEIVETLPDEPSEDTTYVLLSDFVIDYNEFDKSAENVMNGFIEADGSTELMLYYIPVVYKVTFDSNEGLFVDGESVKYVEVPHGSLAADYIPDIDVELEGYDFDGWIGITDSTRIENDFTFVPLWIAKKYDVTWVVDGEETLESYNYKTLINGFAPEKEGYTFIGWTTNPNNYSDLVDFPVEAPLGGATFYAVWEINKHNVIYRIDNELYIEVTDIEYGSSVEIIAEPSKEGFYFGGWNASDFVMPDSDVIINGSWIKETYNVIWHNGDEIITVAYGYGEELVIPSPEKIGYTFMGWHGLDGITVMPDIGEDGDSITFTAVWNANKYNAVFNANDGAFEDGSNSKSVSVDFDNEIKFDEVPVRTGYKFNGWNPDVGVMDSEGKTFEATWIEIERISYTVETYMMNTAGEYEMTSKAYEDEPGVTVNVKPESVNEGFMLNESLSIYEGQINDDGSLVLKVYIDRQNYNLKTVVDGKETTKTYLYGALVSVATPSKTGYTFSGWDSLIPETMPANDVILTGSFTVNKHDVIYMVDGAEYNRIEDVAYGAEVTLIAPLTKEGYTFSGWNASDFVMPDSDVIISGTFAINYYSINWVVDGKTTTETYAFGTAVNVPETPSKTGYTFIGWDSSIPETMPANDVTLTGSFTVNKHDVIYMVDGAEYNRIEDVAYGAEVTLIAPLTKEGYTFSGWNASDFVMPDSDVIISGTFAINYYSINWVVDGKTTTETYAFGTAVNVPATPVKAGYKFIKWNAEIPKNMPAKNLTITAIFDKFYICPDCGDEIVGESAISSHIAMEARMKATVEIKNNPGSKTINYGDILNLTAVITNKPSDAKIYWYVDGSKKGEGEKFKVSPTGGTVEVTVKLVDSNDNVLKDSSGNEISDSQKVSVNAGFFQKIISFFKNLFGSNRNVIQSIKF